MRTGFALSVAAYAVVWWWGLMSLPERVPLHFGIGGDVDRWGSRSEALIGFGILGPAAALVFVVGSWAVGRLPLSSVWVNLPNKDWWATNPDRAARAHRMLRQDMFILGALTMVLLTIAQAAAVTAAMPGQQAQPALPVAWVVAMAAALGLLLGYCGWVTFHRYRIDEEN